MYKQISHIEADRLIKEHDVVIADIRDEDSYKEGHIANAIHLSISALQEYSNKIDKKKAILVYCYHGIASQSAAQNLVELDFKEVYSLAGGFETWKAYSLNSDGNR